MKKLTAVLMIFLIAISCMSGCKNGEEKKTASAGAFVEGATESDENKDTIIENQGGGKTPTQNTDTNPTPSDDDDDKNEPQTPNNNENNKEPQKPNKDNNETPTAPDETPNETPKEDEEDGDEEEVDYKPGNKIKILDYNLRYTDDPDGRSIKERSVRFREVMKKYTPDVCGFQEIVPEWVTYLTADYPDYGSHVQYRAQSNKEGTMVMWNTATMEKVEEGHFWLSDTPDKESKGDSWGETQFYRIVNWAKVKVKATGSVFVFFSTHQNNSGSHPENSARTILTQAKKLGVGSKYGGFCMGDYNIEPWTPGYMGMLEGGIFYDINEKFLSDVTNDGYHDAEKKHIIDYIFYTPRKVHPIHYEVVDMEIDGNYVSDHKGLYAEAALLY